MQKKYVFKKDHGEKLFEDLFKFEVWNNTINGKTFSINKEFDLDKNFEKEILSQYVVQNNETIDFEYFKPMLDNMTQIVQENNVKK